jgi:hypothetical protein
VASSVLLCAPKQAQVPMSEEPTVRCNNDRHSNSAANRWKQNALAHEWGESAVLLDL